jgi:hypothetical protein
MTDDTQKKQEVKDALRLKLSAKHGDALFIVLTIRITGHRKKPYRLGTGGVNTTD